MFDMKEMWNFIQYQILGMKWLNETIGKGLTAIGLDIEGRLGGSIQFFLYDTIKIFVLLCILIFGISYLQSYFPPERTKKILGRFQGLKANTMAALMGTVTPFCSCSSIPLFIGFSRAGLPVGLTFSFLISSPLVDLGSLVLLTSIFGGKAAVAYVLVGLVLAVIAGALLEKFGMERYMESFVRQGEGVEVTQSVPTKRDRLDYAFGQVRFTLKKVFRYILIGVAIGALIHNWIPEEWIGLVLGEQNPFSVILASVVGIPMYADIFGTIPIAEALYHKGVGLGTVMSFMMSVTALSAPSIIMLRRVVKWKLLGVFVGIVFFGIILIGYLFNAISFLLL